MSEIDALPYLLSFPSLILVNNRNQGKVPGSDLFLKLFPIHNDISLGENLCGHHSRNKQYDVHQSSDETMYQNPNILGVLVYQFPEKDRA
jgi:hypothetical protein